MIRVIQLILLFSFFQVGGQNTSIKEQKKEVFVQNLGGDYYNYIELFNENDSLKGMFYGVEIISPTKKPLYYKSALIDLKIDSSEIRFTLNKFSFGTNSFYDNPVDSLISKTLDNVPLAFMFSIRYFGYRHSDTLKMYRTKDTYDSRADEVVFVRK